MNGSKSILSLLVITLLFRFTSFGQSRTENFDFIYDEKKLSGLLDLPAGEKPSSIVLIIPGYGKTNVVAGNGYSELRSNFAKLGIAVCLWDKPGCGQSEGEFDIGQTAQSSADEALAAIEYFDTMSVWLRERGFGD